MVVSVPFNGAISPVLKILFKKKKASVIQDTSQFGLTTNAAMYVSPPDNRTHVTDLVLFSPR